MTTKCSKCGGAMDHGVATVEGVMRGNAFAEDPTLVFVVANARTSANPIKAFQQGMAEGPPDRRYRLVGVRCTSCGAVDLYGVE